MNRTPVWRGARDLIEEETSPEVEQDSQKLTITQTYTGPHSLCMSRRPQPGAPVKGFSNSFVTRTKVTREPGGRGKLVVYSESKDLKQDGEDDGSSPGSQPPSGTSQIEVEWVRTDKPLATHPIFFTLTSETLRKIESAIQAGSAPELGVGPTGLKYYDKRMKGIDSYAVYSPVIRRTTPFSGPPATGDAGKISNPPYSPAGYEYIKTADRSVRQDGRWNRVEEWTGEPDVDSDLYQ